MIDIPKWEPIKAGESPEKKARPWDLLNKNIEMVEGPLADARLDLCKACPEYIKSTHQCKKCGCIMNLKVKVPHATCPLGKWGAVRLALDKEIDEKLTADEV